MSEFNKVNVLLEGNNIAKIENHKNMYLIRGKTSTYLAFKGKFCSCEQFIHRCLRKNLLCYHLEAVNSGKSFSTLKLSDDEIIEILWGARQSITP